MLSSWSRSGWPLRNIHISIDSGSFTVLCNFFLFFLYNCKYFYRTWLYVRNTAVVLSEAATAYTSRAHEFTLTFLVGSVLLISLVLLCCPIMCLSSALRCPLRFQHKTMFGSSYPPVICRRTYLRYMCFFAYRGVQHILCCVFCFACRRLVLSVL